ncbi:ribosome silencing factor [Putridiphycobacter roseus]|uniref:Ribosomal silencing factor RsfS n=1 Tax=Putridiphycobacter roseus TaxID=2219161 RepID=A0A2W1MYD7_9FLAO|nr:ribosome silencing factor [Putridiphycobacter roseus]PZE16867.1 ribosome silencing factor [Putridiphycobacter roseus]
MVKTLSEKEAKTKILVDTIVEGIQDIKGKDIVVLDLREVENSVCDYFIICSGDSTMQVSGISSSVVRHTRKQIQEKPWHNEGAKNAEWLLLDYVSVVVHIFYKSTREYYNIEGLWADAKRTDIPNID